MVNIHFGITTQEINHIQRFLIFSVLPPHKMSVDPPLLSHLLTTASQLYPTHPHHTYYLLTSLHSLPLTSQQENEIMCSLIQIRCDIMCDRWNDQQVDT